MEFARDIDRWNSVCVAGLAKHAGKTECLNYIIGKVRDRAERFAVTSIGLDGEGYDVGNHLSKPEITLWPGMVYVTSEAHYRQKRPVSEVLDVSSRQTALGRLVVARALAPGKVLLSGPADVASLMEVIAELKERFDVGTTLIDGALGRLSPASPAAADALVLATGAVVSIDLETLVRRTAYVCELASLEVYQGASAEGFIAGERGLWSVGANGEVSDLGVDSAFTMDMGVCDMLGEDSELFVGGVLTDRLLAALSRRGGVRVIVRDFTRVFASESNFRAFLRTGGQIKVLRRSKLLGVSVNPVAPNGFRLDSALLQRRLADVTGVPVFDVRNLD